MQENIFSSYPEKENWIPALIPFIVYLLIYLLFFVLEFKPVISYSVIYISISLCFIFLCRHLFRTDLSEKLIYSLLIAGIIIRIIYLFIQPIGSEDYYRYLWDGKVLANGINPYSYAPDDDELQPLHSEILPEKVTFPHIKTIYPPLSLIIFYFSYMIGGESFFGLKFLLLLFELASVLGLLLILKKLMLPKKNILLYALAPLPVFQFFIDAHLDGFGISLLILAILFYVSGKKNLSLIFTGLTICIKPVGLLLLPVLFFNEKGAKAKLKTLALPIIVCAILYIPFLSSSTFESLLNFTVNWTFNGFVFEIINSFLSNNQFSRTICALLFLITYGLLVLSRVEFFNKIYISVFLLLIFSPVVHPWYAVWLAVLLPFIPRWSGILFTSLISLTAFTIINYELYGIWKDYLFVLLMEYVPVVVIFLFELNSINRKKLSLNNN